MDELIQCGNCKQYKVVKDTRGKFIAYGLIMIIPGPIFLYGAGANFIFILIGLVFTLAGIIYMIKAIITKNPIYFCKNCHKKWE